MAEGSVSDAFAEYEFMAKGCIFGDHVGPHVRQRRMVIFVCFGGLTAGSMIRGF